MAADLGSTSVAWCTGHLSLMRLGGGTGPARCVPDAAHVERPGVPESGGRDSGGPLKCAWGTRTLVVVRALGKETRISSGAVRGIPRSGGLVDRLQER